MTKYTYDFHIHSCLSPCADNDMTPANIAGMASLAGINIMALTDHNTVKNCPAFFKAAKRNGVIPIAGMELTTAEDIHVVCLFESLKDAENFGETVDKKRIKIKNRTDIFGEQLILDEQDNLIGVDEYLLSNATEITVEEVPDLVKEYGGVCFPAHVDRQANGIIATLGTFPETPFFSAAEFHDGEKQNEYKEKYPILKEKRIVIGSDAHYLWDIRDADAEILLDDEPYSSEKVRHELFKFLRCED
jgi:DNA polymerase III alpha subunit